VNDPNDIDDDNRGINAAMNVISLSKAIDNDNDRNDDLMNDVIAMKDFKPATGKSTNEVARGYFRMALSKGLSALVP
jgi:hypothetical protein